MYTFLVFVGLECFCDWIFAFWLPEAWWNFSYVWFYNILCYSTVCYCNFSWWLCRKFQNNKLKSTMISVWLLNSESDAEDCLLSAFMCMTVEWKRWPFTIRQFSNISENEGWKRHFIRLAVISLNMLFSLYTILSVYLVFLSRGFSLVVLWLIFFACYCQLSRHYLFSGPLSPASPQVCFSILTHRLTHSSTHSLLLYSNSQRNLTHSLTYISPHNR